MDNQRVILSDEDKKIIDSYPPKDFVIPSVKNPRELKVLSFLGVIVAGFFFYINQRWSIVVGIFFTWGSMNNLFDYHVHRAIAHFHARELVIRSRSNENQKGCDK